MPRHKTPTIFIVSDGRGETATLLVKAAIVQFSEVRHRIVRKANVRTPQRVRQVVSQAQVAKAVIFYTLVSEDTRSAMGKAAADSLVPIVDLLGPAFTALHDLFKQKRGSTPGLLYAMEREQIDRMDAIDYTLKHDDGQRPHELSRADVVLVGVSRASKSSTCFFLAYQGIRAANVPLISNVPPPDELRYLPPEKVVGLRVNVSRLMTVREARARTLGIGISDPYLDKRSISRELLEANRLIESHGWHAIDASYLAVEEIAREVVSLCNLKAHLD